MPILTTGAGVYSTGGSPPSFTDPSSLSNILAWWSADAGLSNDGLGNATTWVDRINSFTLTATLNSGTTKVLADSGTTWLTNGGGNKPSIVFPFSADTVMKTSNDLTPFGLSGASVSVFALMEWYSAVNTNSRYFSYAGNGNSGGHDYDNAGSVSFLSNGGSGNFITTCNSHSSSATSFTASSPARYGVVITAAASVGYVNGSSSGTGTLTGMNLTANGTLYVGNYPAGGLQPCFALRHLVIVNGAMNGTDISNLDTWFVSQV